MPTLPIVFLTPITGVNVNVNNLAMYCKSTIFTYLYVRIADEELRPNQARTVYSSKYHNWLLVPDPMIVVINSLGIQTLKYKTTDYIINDVDGTITFWTPLASTDIVRASYYYLPISDTQMINLTRKSLVEISVLIFRKIDENSIPPDYQVAICKRLYTNVLKVLILEARDYFSVSVGGRMISKTNIVTQFTTIIEENEKQLQEEINILRTFNKTNRILPTIEVDKNINSNSKIS